MVLQHYSQFGLFCIDPWLGKFSNVMSVETSLCFSDICSFAFVDCCAQKNVSTSRSVLLSQKHELRRELVQNQRQQLTVRGHGSSSLCWDPKQFVIGAKE